MIIDYFDAVLWRICGAADVRALLQRQTGHQVIAWGSPQLWQSILDEDIRLEEEGGGTLHIQPALNSSPEFELKVYLHTTRNEVRVKVPEIPITVNIVQRALQFEARIDPDNNAADEYVTFIIKTREGNYHLRSSLLSMLPSFLRAELAALSTNGIRFSSALEDSKQRAWDKWLTEQHVAEAYEEANESPNGVDYEDVGITRPFNPSLIRIETRPMTISLLLDRIREKALDLAPKFQRNDVWKPEAKSRLIESILIRIPLPAFYIDATDEDHWLVVDGLQRLSALKRFMLDDQLRLRGLEFLTQFEGKTYSDLPRNFQRRLLETVVTLYLIERGTPPEVKFNIFKRINTGGLPLSPQEIRHALNQGPVIDFLLELVLMPEFKTATDNGIRDARMTDQECALRFCAFASTSYKEYITADFDAFLNTAMAQINEMSGEKRVNLAHRFRRALTTAHQIFGRDAFRKLEPGSNKRYPINKALFETWSVNLDAISDIQLQTLSRRKTRLRDGFTTLVGDFDFAKAISQGTGDPSKVRLRFSLIADLIAKVLE